MRRLEYNSGEMDNYVTLRCVCVCDHLDAGPEEDGVSLPDVLTNEVLRPLSSDPSVHSQVEPHLPQTSEEVDSVLTSPQFQQALGIFGSALQSGQLGPLMGQFGLGGQVVHAANSGSMLGAWLV